MKRVLRFLPFLLLLMSFGSIAYGQFHGPGSEVRLYTVKEVKESASKLDRSDTIVKLRGYIIKQVNKDTFEFKDSTGKIRIELENNVMPSRTFDDKTEVVLTGEVDYDFLEGTEIEVELIEFVE
ncbi:MAG: NirD/YgiW/YdeI family stress tolerance protein [Tenuifilaceae bacterium]|jgi:uncharacterized protein (TIGR00156 family)|nr:NirD/YgiW/YdeI family stress tolerance protein [Tenuifilaceae bacterium]